MAATPRLKAGNASGKDSVDIAAHEGQKGKMRQGTIDVDGRARQGSRACLAVYGVVRAIGWIIGDFAA
jgi:hypothetical protein